MTLEEARKNAPKIEDYVSPFDSRRAGKTTKTIRYIIDSAIYWHNIAEQLLKEKENG